MFANKKLAILVVLVMIAPIVLAACGATPEPETIIQTVVVEQTKIVVEEGEEVTIIETVEVEVEVPVEVEVEVTAVPEEPVEEAARRDRSLPHRAVRGPRHHSTTGTTLARAARSGLSTSSPAMPPALYALADVTFQFVPSTGQGFGRPGRQWRRHLDLSLSRWSKMRCGAMASRSRPTTLSLPTTPART